MKRSVERVLEWRQTARNDLLAIVDYISDDSPAAASRLVEDIHKNVNALRDYPQRYRAGRVPGTRELVVRPNYVVVYLETPAAVTVLRVLHAAQQWPPDTG